MPFTLDGYLSDELRVRDFPRTASASHTSQLVYLPLGRALPGKEYGTCREAGSPSRREVRSWRRSRSERSVPTRIARPCLPRAAVWRTEDCQRAGPYSKAITSTTTSPSTTETAKRSNPRGLGPARYRPSRSYFSPWQGLTKATSGGNGIPISETASAAGTTRQPKMWISVVQR